MSFRDYAAEQTHTPHAVTEAALAHVVRNKAEAAYARSDLFEKRRADTPTFRAAAVATLEANRPRWWSARTTRAWMHSLEKHAFPTIGALPASPGVPPCTNSVVRSGPGRASAPTPTTR